MALIRKQGRKEERMRRISIALCLAAVFALACGEPTSAAPADSGALHAAANAAASLQGAQYSGRHARHGVVKCYREFVIGPYRCHYFRNPLWWL
jgi:hypothetical protein